MQILVHDSNAGFLCLSMRNRLNSVILRWKMELQTLCILKQADLIISLSRFAVLCKVNGRTLHKFYLSVFLIGSLACGSHMSSFQWCRLLVCEHEEQTDLCNISKVKDGSFGFSSNALVRFTVWVKHWAYYWTLKAFDLRYDVRLPSFIFLPSLSDYKRQVISSCIWRTLCSRKVKISSVDMWHISSHFTYSRLKETQLCSATIKSKDAEMWMSKGLRKKHETIESVCL